MRDLSFHADDALLQKDHEFCVLCYFSFSFFQKYGTTEVYKDVPSLEVRLPDVNPEAFHLVLNYVYTDRIDPTKQSKKSLILQVLISSSLKIAILWFSFKCNSFFCS